MTTNTERANQIVTDWFIRNGMGVNTSLTISDFYGLMGDIEKELNKRTLNESVLTKMLTHLSELGYIKPYHIYQATHALKLKLL